MIMTKVEMFNAIKEVVKDNAEMVEFLDKQISLIKNRKTSETKTQKENKVIMESIVVALDTIGKPVTITELMKTNEEMAVFSNQKLSALLKKLVESGRVVKTTDKKVSTFALAEVEED